VNEYISAECDDGNVCTDDGCDPASGCFSVCAPEGKAECELTVGDYIWTDLNGDGLQLGEGDEGIGGVKLNLLDCSSSEPVVLDMTDTAADGSYEFVVSVDPATCSLDPEKLQIEVDDSNFEPGGPLEGQLPSPKNVGQDDTIDSDCDAGLTDCTTQAFGTDDPTIDCGFFAACEVTVDKTCCIVPPAPPVTGSDCDGKITGLKLEFTGDGCDVITNPQEGKVTCSGSSDFMEPVDIQVTSWAT
jgi:hypothetical protein